MPFGSEEFGAAVRDHSRVGALGFEGDAEIAGVVHAHA